MSHVFEKEECPAWGKKCVKCGGKNHIKGSDKCPKTKHGVNRMCETEDDSEDYDSESSCPDSITSETTISTNEVVLRGGEI